MNLHEQIVALMQSRALCHAHCLTEAEQVRLLDEAVCWIDPWRFDQDDIRELDQLIRDHKLEAMTSPVDWIRHWVRIHPDMILTLSHLQLFAPRSYLLLPRS